MRIILNKGAPHRYRREAELVTKDGDLLVILMTAQMSREVRPLGMMSPFNDTKLVIPLAELQMLVRRFSNG